MFENAVELARLIDHTLLSPTATPSDIDRLCAEAVEYSFHSVCVNPYHVGRAATRLKDSGVGVCSVVGFPFGATTTAIKVLEGTEAVKSGASELDMVMNVGLFKAGEYELAAQDVRDFMLLTPGVVHKIIVEACYLNDAEKAGAATLASELGAEFIKTSTGYGPGGATPEDVMLLVDSARGKSKVKASGGIRDLATLRAMVEAGAHRIGTSSGVAIVREFIEAGV